MVERDEELYIDGGAHPGGGARIDVVNPATGEPLDAKNDPALPWGGFGNSGYGKENAWDALGGTPRLQSVVVGTGDGFQDW